MFPRIASGLVLALLSATAGASTITKTIDQNSPQFTVVKGPPNTYRNNYSWFLGGIKTCAIATDTHRYEAFAFTPSVTGNYIIDTTNVIGMGSTGDNFLAVYNGVFNPQNPANNLVVCDDDSSTNSQAYARASSNLVAGQTYTFVTTSFNSVERDEPASRGTATYDVNPDIFRVFTLNGRLSGLGSGKSVALATNEGDSLTVSANGDFTFAQPIVNGQPYQVTVSTQPANQTCSISNGNGTVSGDVKIGVTCVDWPTVGGQVSGLTQPGLVLQNNGGDDLTVNASGAFQFASQVQLGGTYNVTIGTTPTGFNCSVANGSGTANADVSNVAVTCIAIPRTIGGTLSGLAAGASVTLTNGGTGEALALSANGAFSFTGHQSVGESYSVTVTTAPTKPNQNCTVTNGSGTVAGSDVSNIAVACTTLTYTVGGTVSGLSGTGLQLDNGGASLPIGADGAFTFPPQDDETAYNVTVSAQPTGPSQTCSVANGAGTVSGGNVTNLAVTCADNPHTVGGAVTGLAPGGAVTLSLNGSHDLVVNSNTTFTFPAIANGSAYAVTVKAEPTSPNQQCTVSNGSGTINDADVSNVAVNCVTRQYTVGGTVAGLSGTGLVLTNNGGDNLAVAPGATSFTFATAIDDLDAYAVAVGTPPSSPSETCTITNGAGNIAGADVTNITVNCQVDTFPLGGTVTDLALNDDLVLQTNTGKEVTVTGSGTGTDPFTFTPEFADLSSYLVSVKTQPPSPSQTCTVANASGTFAGAAINNVQVVCATDTFSIGGTVTGLAAGTTLELSKNSGDLLTVSADGAYTFPTELADGSDYVVAVSTQPTGPSQTCTVSNGSGTLAGSDVTNVDAACVIDQFPVGGTVTGLAGGATLRLQSRNGDVVDVTADGAYAFPPIDDLTFYEITVLQQPLSPSQTCILSNPSGNVAGQAVTDIDVACSTDTFTVGGTVSGLNGSGLVLAEGGDTLAVAANGPFVFPPHVDGTSYDVLVQTQPSNPGQTCTVTNGAGTLAGGRRTAWCLMAGERSAVPTSPT
jgi:hypothetical protein